MHRNRSILIALALAAAASAAFADGTRGRGLLVQLGIGPGFPTYGSELDAAMSAVEDLPGVSRTKIALDLGLGVAVSPEAYLMGRVDGTGDRLSSGGDSLQLNAYLYSLGFRYYPAVTGLYLEGCYGLAKAVIQTEGSISTSVSSDDGSGWGAAIGYDFARRPTGFGVALECRYHSLSIEGDTISAVMLTINLLFK